MYMSVTCSKSNTFLFLTTAVLWRYTTGKRDVIVVHGGIRILPVPQVLVPLSPRLGRGACKTGTVKNMVNHNKTRLFGFSFTDLFWGVCLFLIFYFEMIYFLFIYLPIWMNLLSICLCIHFFHSFFHLVIRSYKVNYMYIVCC